MADGQESLVQTVARNITPEVDTSRSALPPDQRMTAEKSPQQEGEEQYGENFGSPVQKFYGKLKNLLAEHEGQLDEKILKPFRQGLDNMGDDLVEKGLQTHTPILAAAGEGLKAVPVGSDVKSTAAALMVPPEVGEEGALSKAFGKLEGHAEIPPTVEHLAASGDTPAQVILKDATGKKIGGAKWTQKGDEAHLNGIYADTKGAGHGKQLLNSVIDKAKESGAKGLTVGEVNSASPDAIGLFDRHKEHPVETIQSPVKGSQARRISFEDAKKAAPKDVIEKQGLKYKGELTPGSGVHMFEHPDHPGQTASLKDSEITPDAVRTKMDSKLKEFEASEKMKSRAAKKGSESL